MVWYWSHKTNCLFRCFINCKALPWRSGVPLGIILGRWIDIGFNCLLEDADNLDL